MHLVVRSLWCAASPPSRRGGDHRRAVITFGVWMCVCVCISSDAMVVGRTCRRCEGGEADGHCLQSGVLAAMGPDLRPKPGSWHTAVGAVACARTRNPRDRAGRWGGRRRWSGRAPMPDRSCRFVRMATARHQRRGREAWRMTARRCPASVAGCAASRGGSAPGVLGSGPRVERTNGTSWSTHTRVYVCMHAGQFAFGIGGLFAFFFGTPQHVSSLSLCKGARASSCGLGRCARSARAPRARRPGAVREMPERAG